MKKTLLKLVLTFACASASFLSYGQTYLGIQSSNYAGVMGLDYQPASFVDGRFKVDVNLFSFNLSAWQNAKYFDANVMPKWWAKSLKADKDAQGNPNGFQIGGTNPNNDWAADSAIYANSIRNLYDYADPNAKVRGIYIGTQIDILNFAFHINPKIAVGGIIRTRAIGNVDDIDPKLAKLAEEGLDFSQLWQQNLNDKIVTANIMAWNEYGLNYAQVISDKDQHFFKGGGTFKVLQGLTSAYAYTDQLSYNLNNQDTAFTLQGNFKYGYSEGTDRLFGSSSNPADTSLTAMQRLFPKNAPLGVGVDLGFVYEWRPDHAKYKYDMDGKTNIWSRTQNKYKLRTGVSILDIGGIKYTKGGTSRDFNVNATNFDLRIFDKANSFASFDSIIDSLLNAPNSGWVSTEGVSQQYYMNTPTRVSLQVDYNIWKWFYINATGTIGIVGKKNVDKVKMPNQFSVTPGFDQAWFGFYVPVSYNTYSGWKGGMATRLGPLTVGMYDFNTIFARNKVRGTEFFVGLRVPILYTDPEDSDKDKVSDKVDECKDIPGIWAFKGCPDTDGDGIKDAEDTCPTEPGLPQFKGCPDRDGDSIPDKDDECPDLAGLQKFRGCPDTDGDSIIDPKDDCPEVPGIPAFNGCPDTDGDGIKDSEDACPDAAGPIANQGCPDTDNDGIFDFVDNCPTEYGPKENNGCPWPDTDGDGLIDKDDDCPYLFGPLKNKGCPFQDTDGDGILDKDDDCPTVKGVVENKGCPKIEVEEQEILNTAFENLEFNTGNAIIKDVSFASLNELAALMIKKPEWKLQISGHTDNVGEDQKNLVLSKQRAEAVKKYLSDKGVDPKRFNTLFFGETQPIAPNDTPEGRQKNRRVEMKVIF